MPRFYAADTLNFLRKLRMRRVVNACKVLLSYYYSRMRKRPVIWGLPLAISFEPTTACNLRCPECPSGLRAFSRPTGNLREDFFRSTIDHLYRELFYLIFYFQGEPYINPAFLDMAAYAAQKGLYTITSTNGHFLNEENARRTVESGLDRLIISVDGATQDVYEAYRIGGKLDVVLQGAKNVIAWKRKLKSSKPHIVFQFLVVRPNEAQIPEIYRLAREIGVDEVRLKTAQIYDYQKGSPLIPIQEQYSRYRKLPDGTFRIKNKLLNHCWKMWHACVITWDGLVVPCCFDKDATHRLGDLKNDPFRSIWTGMRYQDFRSALLKGRNQIDICTNCTEGSKIWA
ncbi:MAG: SPASM domain-containing protein [Haliscomenobacter sp.]|nr:SPASM domain-containing protein [Haliscomenobacter sp.]MBK8878065.1 SPASM domain-containing protein [Haliscomenobacter sp.]